MTPEPNRSHSQNSPMFTPSSQPRSLLPWAIASGLVLLVTVGFALFWHQAPKKDTKILLPLAPSASQLIFSDIVMSESTSLSGGKSTFIDGHVHNLGPRTVKSVSLQVLFGNFDPSQPEQIESVPLSLIRTHEPYIDTQPVSAEPLAPGTSKEFRLIFEDISLNWNQQLPILHAVAVDLR